MNFPELWIIAGPNGAGKTTCVKRKPISELIPNVVFFNPDERTLVKLQASGFRGFSDAPQDVQAQLFFQSADEVFAELQQALYRKERVGVETVLSTDKYRRLVEIVKAEGGIFCLIYVALASPTIAKERVAARVKRGGHGIPDDKIEQRWKRSLENMGWFAQQADYFWIVDNSSCDPQDDLELVAHGKLGTIEFLDEHAFPRLQVVLQTLLKSN